MQVCDLIGIGVLAQHTLGLVTGQLQHQEVADTGQEILDKPLRFESANHHFLDYAIQAGPVMIDQGIHRLTNQGFGGEAQEGHRRVIGDGTVHGPHHKLVQNGEGIAHGTAACPHGQLQHTRLGLDVLLGADFLQVRPHDLLGNQTEGVMMGPGTDRADDLFRFGGRKDEHDMLWRLFDNLEQGVESLLGDHMGLIEDEYLVPVTHRREARTLPEFPCIIDPVVAGRINLHHID